MGVRVRWLSDGPYEIVGYHGRFWAYVVRVWANGRRSHAARARCWDLTLL